MAALVIVKRVAKEKVVTFKTADWATLKERMAAQNFQGEVVASELVDEHLAEVEKLTENTQAVESVPEEVELPDTVE